MKNIVGLGISGRRVVVSLVVVLLFCPTAMAQRVIYVTKDAAGANDGSSWTNAYTSLQDALAAAQKGDEIWVAAGIYYPDEGIGMTDNYRKHAFRMKSGVAIYGGFVGVETDRSEHGREILLTVLSGDLDQNDIDVDGDKIGEEVRGNNAYHVVVAENVDSTAVLDGFVIRQGVADGGLTEDQGGGLYIRYGSPTLENVIIKNNVAAGVGGGVYIRVGSPTFSNVTVSNNMAADKAEGGGGIYIRGGDTSLKEVTIINNSAESGDGGGIYLTRGELTIVGGDIKHNYSFNVGGGVYNGGATLIISDVTISDNTAQQDGGGIYNSIGPLALTGVTISYNAASNGGGLYLKSVNHGEYENVLIYKNHSDGSGGGVYDMESDSAEWRNVSIISNDAMEGGGYFGEGVSHLVFINSLLADNSGGDCVGSLYPTSRNNLIQDASYACELRGAQNGNIVGSDARVLNVESLTTIYLLLMGSPALDTGDMSVCPAKDVRGVRRPQDGDADGVVWCDIGALEMLPVEVVPVFTDSAMPLPFRYYGHFPNPVRAGTVELWLDLPVDASVSVEVFDVQGRLVRRVPGKPLEAGRKRHLQMDVDDLAGGMYVYRVLVESAAGERKVFTGQLVRVH